MIMEILVKSLTSYPLVTAFVLVGLLMYVATLVAKIFKGRIHASAIAIVFGLILAFIGGKYTGGKHGISDVTLFSGHRPDGRAASSVTSRSWRPPSA